MGKRESRWNALWGKGGRGFAGALTIVVLGLAAPLATTAAAGSAITAFVPADLLAAAKTNPGATFSVIVQGDAGTTSDGVAAGTSGVVDRRFSSISGVAARLTGGQLLELAATPGISAITEDAPVSLTGWKNRQKWPNAARIPDLWEKAARGLKPPTIAIVDSGIDSSNPTFEGRVLAQVDLTSLTPNSPGDGRGHGTFVAGIAAGAAFERAGAAPNANLVSLDVMDDNGMALTSDVIAAADWILRNKDSYNIRVANFSLNASTQSSFMYDPLDKAVEKLWFAGVVVVTAAGNYAVDGQPSGVLYAPANDPFVLTVGASDINGTSDTSDDFAAPWSANGYTPDGFLKPELAAPGRFLEGPVPTSSTMPLQHPERLVAPGYMWMSGTSFAAPIVSGIASYALALHPDWTPDQVKGALMSGARCPSGYTGWALGVGVVSAHDLDEDEYKGAPWNPNLALDGFLVSDGAGGRTFDAASWASAARASASWSSASWSSASWSSASWNSASWSSASWSSASWSSASWSSSAPVASWASLIWVS